jgi:GTP:adenosylcobinamide-phosphate guanylyltransferase
MAGGKGDRVAEKPLEQFGDRPRIEMPVASAEDQEDIVVQLAEQSHEKPLIHG